MKLYRKIHEMFSAPGEKGEYSAGAWQDMVRRKALELCASREGRLLEVGCGEGLFLRQVKERVPGLECFGIDISVERLKAAGSRLGGVNGLSVQDAGRLSFPDGCFDTVVCINVLFNLGSRQAVAAVMREIARVARPGARIIVDFRNRGNPLLGLKYALAPLYDPTVRGLPLRTYSLSEVRALLAGAGLTVVRAYPLGFAGKTFAPVIVMEAKR